MKVPWLTWTLSREASSLYLSAMRATSLPPGRTMPPVTSLVRGTAWPATCATGSTRIRKRLGCMRSFWVHTRSPDKGVAAKGSAAVRQYVVAHAPLGGGLAFQAIECHAGAANCLFQCAAPRIRRLPLICVLPQHPI